MNLLVQCILKQCMHLHFLFTTPLTEHGPAILVAASLGKDLW